MAQWRFGEAATPPLTARVPSWICPACSCPHALRRDPHRTRPHTMSQAASDRNLLFGILALQMDFISRDALVAAMHAWVLDKQKSLGGILVACGALARGHRAL